MAQGCAKKWQIIQCYILQLGIVLLICLQFSTHWHRKHAFCVLSSATMSARLVVVYFLLKEQNAQIYSRLDAAKTHVYGSYRKPRKCTLATYTRLVASVRNKGCLGPSGPNFFRWGDLKLNKHSPKHWNHFHYFKYFMRNYDANLQRGFFMN